MVEFSLKTFIQESNRIDPQPDDRGGVIPGQEPGDLLYDNQRSAYRLTCRLFRGEYYPHDLAEQIHRRLTEKIPFFVDRGLSGVFRPYKVSIGGEVPPPPENLSVLMYHWGRSVSSERDKVLRGERDPYEAAWWAHDCFECVHPFADGNGRTGRLILNGLLMAFGQTPIVVYYDDRHRYYEKIREFRRTRFQAFLCTAV